MHSTEIVVAPGFRPGSRMREAAVRRGEPVESRGRRVSPVRALASMLRSRVTGEGDRRIEPPRRELPVPFC